MKTETRTKEILQTANALLTRPYVVGAGLAILISLFAGIFIGVAPYELDSFGIPAPLIFIAPLAGFLTILFALHDFDRMVLLAFMTIGFVQIEPAPFDIFIIVLLVAGFLNSRLRYRDLAQPKIILIGLWGFVLAYMLSTIGVVPAGHSLRFLLITLYQLSIFIFVRMYAEKPNAARIVINGYIVSAAVSALLGVLGLLEVGPAGQLFTESGMRAHGFFKDSNVYASFFIPPILFIIDRIMQRPFTWRYTLPQGLLAIWLVTGTIISFSRAAWINLAFGIFLYAVLLSRSMPRRQVMTLLTTMIALLLVAILVMQITGSIGFVLERWSFKAYDLVRFETQAEGVIAGITNLTGVGPGQWPSSHSLYARTLAEQGIPGIASLALLIGALLLGLARKARNEPLQAGNLPARVLLPILIGFMINSVVIDTIHWRHFWAVLGLAWFAILDQSK